MNHDTELLLGVAAVEACFFALMLHKRSWKFLPVFSLFIAWTLVSDIVYLLITRYQPAMLYKVYPIEVVLDSILQFSVLVELAWSVLRPVRSSLPKGSLFALIVMVAIVGLIIWPLAGQTVPSNLADRGKFLFHLTQTVAILRVVCFLVMASFSQILSIGWRDRELQVATGFGFYSIITLIVAVIHTHQDVKADLYHELDLAGTVSYLCTLSYWILSFSAKEQERKEFSQQMQQILVSIGGSVHSDRIAVSDIQRERSKRRKL